MSSNNAPLDWNDIKDSAYLFIQRYKDKKKEASYKQLFWNDFLSMFGVDLIEKGQFEYYVKMLNDERGEIDFFWPGQVIIEHKSSGKDLDAALDQAMRYMQGIKKEEKPRYIIVSDFQRIRLFDLKEFKDITIKLEDLPEHVDLFGFLAGYSDRRIEGQHPVNVKAAKIIANFYVFLEKTNYPKEYRDVLLIRLVFCLFAEDADIFEKRIFTEYVMTHSNDDGVGMGDIIQGVFTILDTPITERQSSTPASLQQFPYVDGGLFSETIPPVQFNRKMRECLNDAANLDWKYISPAIFGSLFQSVMDEKKRSELGAHYTSEENILKLINPLFMDDLRAEYETIKNNQPELKKFASKIADIKVIDPACGCGNFLIIAYRELRKLEMDVFDALYGKAAIYHASHIKIDNFHGIEYLAFPAHIAQVSLILMEHLTNLYRKERFGKCDSIIPLEIHNNIVTGNALTIDWEDVVKPDELSYIIGNPPFKGSKKQSDEQKEDLKKIVGEQYGVIDYVAAWYYKAADMMKKNPKIRTAFVSTNSIIQGEQVAPIWRPLLKDGLNINFAYLSFKWGNEAEDVAGVHVIIVGFSYVVTDHYIYEVNEKDQITKTNVSRINAYLTDYSDIYLESRGKPLLKTTPTIVSGCQPIDDGNYLFTEEEKEMFLQLQPEAEPYMHPWIGSQEFIKGIKRYCLWLVPCPKEELMKMKYCVERVNAVREYRLKSDRKQTRECASRPVHFYLEVIMDDSFIIIPEVSSESREYIPMCFMYPDVMCSNKVRMVPGATLYHFGILTSHMHMCWVNYVCGRLETRYDYSIRIVYNNFPWPNVSEELRKKIEKAAQDVLNAREKHTELSLGQLYKENMMYDDLFEAHKKLDKIVDQAYNKKGFDNDKERIKLLFDMYLEQSTTGSNGQSKLIVE